MGSLAALLAPLLLVSSALGGAEVDPRIAPAFAHAPRQKVIVEVVDESRDLPAAFLPVRAERERRQAAREALLGTRKDRVLSRLGPSAVARPLSRWPSFPLMAVEADAAAVRALAADPEVRRLHFDRLARPLATTSFAFTGATAWHAQGQEGVGTSVAVLDSTVRYDNGAFGDCPRPGVASCMVSRVENFSPDDAASVAAGESHGTNVAGIVLAMAPKTRILSLNVFHFDPSYGGYVSSESDELDALQWLVLHAADYRVVAANMSLGADWHGKQPCNSDALFSAFKSLWETAGVLVTVASGNTGDPNGLGTPACISLAVTVAAQYDVAFPEMSGCGDHFGHAGDMACFSDRSGMVDLVAPGVDIDAGGLYGFTGTSMAAPHVAGAIALLQGVRKSQDGTFWPPEQLHRKLVVDAFPLLVAGWPFSQLRVAPEARSFDSLELARWPREATANEILLGAGAPLVVQAEASGLGREVEGVYLYLEVVHKSPQDLQGTLIAPSGKKVDFRLPAGLSNFVGVVGHTLLPGAFAALAGGPADGTWKLELRDLGTTGKGSLLEAALYWPKAGCVPECRAGDCGDEGCGGACPVCIIQEECLADGTRQPGDPCHACDAEAAAKSWSPTSGEPCDDGDICTRVDVCVEGACTGTDPVVCSEADQCHLPGSCDSRDGTCGILRKEDGVACDDANACTAQDHCRFGACVGEAKACPAEECRQAGSCDPATGACAPGAAVADGTTCSKGSCHSGECKGGCGCGAGGEPGSVVALAALLLLGKARSGRRRG